MQTAPLPPSARPLGADSRIAALDVIRGLAVLGILVMNIPWFALPDGFYGRIWSEGGPDLTVWYVQDALFDGRMRALFSMLFGAGALLFLQRAIAAGQGLGAADLYYRRMLWLLLFGLLHAWVLLWPGDILYGYALSGLFLFPLRKLGPRELLIVGLLLLSVGVPQAIYSHAGKHERWAQSEAALVAEAAGQTPSEAQAEALEWRRGREERRSPSADKVAEEIATRTGGYVAIWRDAASVTFEDQSSGFYSKGLFDHLGMMLIGMALLLSGFFEGRWRRSRYLILIALGFGLAVPFTVAMAVHWIASGAPLNGFDQVLLFNATYHYVRLAVALAIASTLVLAVRAGVLEGLARRLAATGRMALTHYVSQTVICSLLLFGPLGGLFGRFSLFELMGIVLAIWALQLAVSPLWLARYRFGPLEWLWRSLTYGARQPMLRKQPSGSAMPVRGEA